jgi:dolichol kinase
LLQRIAGLLVFGGERRSGPTAQPRIWRRLFHVFAGSAIPICGIFAPEREFLFSLAVLAAGALALDLSRFGIGPLNRAYMRWMSPLLKRDEERHITGATYMLIAAVPVFWLYGKDVGVPVMFYLSLGDPVAAIVGSRMPGPRLLGKSPGGTAAFWVTGAAAAGLLIATGAVEHHWALWPGAAISALTELAGLPPDDNLTIPLIAGSAMWAMGA